MLFCYPLLQKKTLKSFPSWMYIRGVLQTYLMGLLLTTDLSCNQICKLKIIQFFAWKCKNVKININQTNIKKKIILTWLFDPIHVFWQPEPFHLLYFRQGSHSLWGRRHHKYFRSVCRSIAVSDILKMKILNKSL